MKKQTTTAIILSLLLSLSVQAQNGQGRGNGEGKGKYHQQMIQELDLTEQQQKDMKALKESKPTDRKAKREEAKKHREELDELLRASSVDKNAIDNKIAEISKMTAEKMNARIDHLLEVKKILTPEQFNTFLDLKKEKMQNKRKGKGKGKGKGHRNNQ